MIVLMWGLVVCAALLESPARAFSVVGRARTAASARCGLRTTCLAAESDIAGAATGPATANAQARDSVRRSLGLLSQAALLLSPWAVPAAARAAQGAFEMDAEFYLRNLLQIQDKQKSETRSAIFKSPRRINKGLATDIITIMKDASGLNISEDEVADEVAKNIRMFKGFAPITTEDNGDQYFFDLNTYALYLIIARRMPESRQRVLFRARVGEGVLNAIIKRTPQLVPLLGENQADIAKGIELILKCLQDNGLIEGFNFDSEDFGDEVYSVESFRQGLPISTNIQVVAPANVLSFIQGVKEDTFFHPEWIGTTLVQFVQRCGHGALSAQFEDYLLDNVYRESNFIVQAQDVLIEFRMGRTSDGNFLK